MKSKTRYILFVQFILVIFCLKSCSETDNSNQDQNVFKEATDGKNMNGHFYGEGKEGSRIVVHSDSSGSGYLKLLNHGYNDQYLGCFSDKPEVPQFDFFVEENLGVGICKTYLYQQYKLTIDGNGGFDSLKINIQYLNQQFDTSCYIYDTLNIIPMREFSDQKMSLIEVSFDVPKFDLEALKLEYYYSGIEFSRLRNFDTAHFCHFSQGKYDSVIVYGLHKKHHLFSNETESFSTNFISQ